MSAVKSLAATPSAIHTDPRKKAPSTCFSREQNTWNGKPLSTTAIVIHKVRLRGEFRQGVNSQGGVHLQVTGQRLKNEYCFMKCKHLVLHQAISCSCKPSGLWKWLCGKIKHGKIVRLSGKKVIRGESGKTELWSKHPCVSFACVRNLSCWTF